MMGRDGTSGRNSGNKWPLWQIHQKTLSNTVCCRDSEGFRLRLTQTADCRPALCWAGCCACWLLQEGCSSFHTTAPKPLAAVPRDHSILFAITINYILKYTGTCVEVELLFKQMWERQAFVGRNFFPIDSCPSPWRLNLFQFTQKIYSNSWLNKKIKQQSPNKTKIHSYKTPEGCKLPKFHF